MKTLAAITFANLCILSGCAGTTMGRGSDLAAEPRSGLTIDLTTSDSSVAATFPKRLNEVTTPRQANLLASRVVTELGGEARAALNLCVDASGNVTKSEIATSSGIAELDQVFSNEGRSWRYQPLALRSATVCQNVEIAYRVR